MPIPFLIAGAAAIAGAVGVYKGSKSVSNNNEANRLYDRASEMYEEAKSDLEHHKELTTDALSELGELKLQVWSEKIGRFVNLASLVSDVNIQGRAAVVQYQRAELSHHELIEMKDISLKAQEVVGNGVRSLGAGALAGVASYGGAMMFASASTGTAISALTGVAATNATLAWLGGGSLAAGGLGMAGGMAVLGGIVAGPILAVGGILMEAKSKLNLAEAKANYAKASQAVEELNNATSVMKAIRQISEQFTEAIEQLNIHMSHALDELEYEFERAMEHRNKSMRYRVKRAIYNLFKKEVSLEYRQLNEEQQKLLHVSYQMAQTMKVLLETPLLHKDGSIDENCRMTLEETKPQLQFEY